MEKTIIIGTRGSKLALWQANFTKKTLEAKGYKVELKIIKTKGDKIQHLSFDKIEGKGFFTKEIETALLSGYIDMAVHSYKDMPTQNTPGLQIAANSYRENPTDCLLIKQTKVDTKQALSLAHQAVVGTSSSRRKAQLLAIRPDLRMKDIRGNVPTRIGKLANEFDAIVLASAGISRLNIDISKYYTLQLPPNIMVSAPAQGVLAYQIRENDSYMQAVLVHLHDLKVAECINIERKILAGLGGGCQQPIGVYCKQNEHTKEYEVWSANAKSWQDFPVRSYVKGQNAQLLVSQSLQALRHHKEKQPTKVFISRALSENSWFFRAMQARNYHTVAQSLISFKPVAIDHLPKCDWLFFSSKNAVRFFFAQNEEEVLRQLAEQDIQVACLGKGTASTLPPSIAPNFIGEVDASIEEIANNFLQQAVGKTVVFPQAKHSISSISSLLNKQIKVIPLTVYNNLALSDFNIPQCDILVFTSPLNAKTYCSKYSFKADQKVIAIGNTTGNTLLELGAKNLTFAHEASEVGLADVCFIN